MSRVSFGILLTASSPTTYFCQMIMLPLVCSQSEVLIAQGLTCNSFIVENSIFQDRSLSWRQYMVAQQRHARYQYHGHP